jgi:hypothetical protein
MGRKSPEPLGLFAAGLRQTERRVNRILVAVHFGTQSPPCEWVVWIPHHLHSLSFRDFYQKAAGIRAIIGTDRSLNLSWHESLPIDKSIFHLDSEFNLILDRLVMAGWVLPIIAPRQKASRGNPSPKAGRGDFSRPPNGQAKASPTHCFPLQ